MSADFKEASSPTDSSETLLEQIVKGSRKTSNYIVASMLAVGGIGFSLASLSSYFGIDLLPLGNPSTLIFVPQGLFMGFYGIAATFISVYLWALIKVDYGSGLNRFDKNKGVLSVSRKGLLKEILVEIPIDDIQAVKLEVREGFNPRRRITLRLQGRRDLPISEVGGPQPLLSLEQEGAEIARFLKVNLEGLSN
ncbi:MULTISPECIES: photosystem I assembly protein Ycf4 [Prochlorococcus]|uniref:Photosystem I assembly protein Ycf4 n=1 Tax=Prochlorococcus marinus (strain SARG / CCMP1375 / SS120) TaxID=167539 RepID=YCF4_PROMA|nr:MULTISPECIES: photosystem I assembly protein Ycf4 [Prochlorococcus]Q7VB45.1 RecName: Full=Photosystem I assembly protein Ycf4 [Prochlorococcus marinus subsp. marinus str. CCMP1375]AAQ00298.1 Photosystem I assembly protein [Prochlorococcus marinus subsp. marinus str. CCMP1375]KGG14109.1 photosystem I assembly related protein Ycf4 [Prochlorococcus marinus str. LG]KGG20723.1 photosystem I assembly related protein Ycf4 [Prochlorococcus marinus str. SS2]KGG25124.1 photosystem I assembly related 